MQLRFESYGEGVPLIILHGLFGSLENWRTLAKELGRTYRVFTVDLRNHGGSPHSDLFNYEVMAEDVREFVAGESLDSFHLLGHSMGGKVAMHVALSWPELVAKLVVVDMAPKEYHRSHNEILEALLDLHPERYSQRREMEVALSARIPESGIRQFLLKNIVADSAGGFSWRINLEAIARNYHELTKGIDAPHPYTKPTLFLRGENSRYVLPEDHSLITSLFPAARLESVPDAGHWVHAENPGYFLQALLTFLYE